MRPHNAAPRLAPGVTADSSTGCRPEQVDARSVAEVRLRVLLAAAATIALPEWHTRGRAPLHLASSLTAGKAR